MVETILDSADDGIILFAVSRDEQGKIDDFQYNFLNRSAERIIGKSKDEITGRKLLEVFPAHRESGLFDAYARAIDNHKVFRTEWFYEADGLRNWFRILAQPLDDKLLVSFNDITDYKRLIEEQTHSASLYRALIKSLPHAYLIMLDQDLKCILAEGNPLKAFGFDGKIHEGEQLRESLPAQIFDEIYPSLKTALEGEAIRTEVRRGESLFRIHFQPVNERDSQLFSILILSEDIAIFQKTSNELRNQIYALESANESLEQFAYVASHDLQEPLRKIRAFGDRIQAKYRAQLDDTGQDYLSRMQNAAGRMQKLIDDLLKFSRAGRIQRPFEPVPLQQVIEQVVDSLQSVIEERGAEVEVDALPEIIGDEVMLEQLFQNLISNGIKFCPEDKTPHVKIYMDQAAGSGDGSDTEKFWQILVEDNGIGFDEKYLDRIFEIFQRLHGRHTYSGTGIGLAICKKIVDVHQGQITARSQPGQGATFMIRLPKTSNI